MLLFIARRLLSAIPVLFVVSLMTFVIMWLVPGDVSAEIGGTDATPEQIQQIREQLGIDRPLLERAVNWYGNLLRGDLGHSYLLNRSVVDAVLERLPVTLSLAGLSLVLATIMGTLLGILAAVRHNSWVDQGSMVAALIGLSIPDFWFGLVLIILFGVTLGWLPTGGFVPITEDVLGWVRCMTLPALTLAFTQMGVIARMTRSSMLDVLDQDFVRTARAKGMRARTVIFKHALRNALVPIVTVVGVTAGVLLSGAVVIESVFSLPGVGRLIVGSIQRRDFPVIQGGLLVTASIFVFVNIVVDMLYGWLDPRVRDER
ncbi:MAG: ABC transporter permease [Devosia sp.]|uniref:ABC transporter permease n=1 Tax=unclassified Devosia TaxID=196773 RepID=UPI00092715F3|nr:MULTISPECIES: ABC transporter permease [unclassified Devosia]MBL8597749.1 ABC transporter permease [Devosia sp.]MBN9345363.1 ABC transporter permease [Devosia sp.]OJX50740.1 MAG: peptide ABC transporter [Devosia sp. 66-22]